MLRTDPRRAKASELKVGLVSPPDITINFRKVRDIGMTVPLSFFEAAGTIYDYDGEEQSELTALTLWQL